jgi:hypothetical protein
MHNNYLDFAPSSGMKEGIDRNRAHLFGCGHSSPQQPERAGGSDRAAAFRPINHTDVEESAMLS